MVEKVIHKNKNKSDKFTWNKREKSQKYFA